MSVQPNSQDTKSSFKPIANSETTVLILGSLPGDKSLELGEYYGHPRNRLWNVLSAITGQTLPGTYAEKKELLINSNIGLWDIAHTADRKGSLDSAISNEIPNDLNHFLLIHKNIKVIGFNGKKSQALYDKYFERIIGITYISLPSTSPANARISFEELCGKWREIFG